MGVLIIMQTITRTISFLFFTILFIAFLMAWAMFIWFFSGLVENFSYKAVVFFIGLMITANVLSKYMVWSMNHWN